jgi:hypothetical protein
MASKLQGAVSRLYAELDKIEPKSARAIERELETIRRELTRLLGSAMGVKLNDPVWYSAPAKRGRGKARR